MGIAAGGGEFARRGMLGYQRTEEITADRSAITYLNETGQSAKGMLETFQRFQSALSLSGTQVDPYQISHPMPQERIANLEALATRAPISMPRTRPPCSCATIMMRAKIAAFTGDPALSQAVPQESRPAGRGLRRCHLHLSARQPEIGIRQDRRADQGSSRKIPISTNCAAISC